MRTESNPPPPLETCCIRDTQGRAHTFTGYLLGFGSSQLETHIHAPGQPPPEGLRCTGCRWTEVRLYWSPGDPEAGIPACYVAGIKGHSELPAEPHRYRCWWATSAQGALLCLVVTPPPRRARGVPGEKELPVANRLCLEMAAEHDSRVDAALSDWEALEQQARALDEPVVPHPTGLSA